MGIWESGIGTGERECGNVNLQRELELQRELNLLCTMLRSSSRSNKGMPPPPFNWTFHGKCWTVKNKLVVLPRQVGKTRVHYTPRAMITKSDIPWAGNGLFLRQEVSRAGLVLAEYKGKILSIDDAYHLKTLVRSRNYPAWYTESSSYIFAHHSNR